jgi:hypothetical protein
LLSGEDGGIFLAVGSPTKAEFIGLRQAITVNEEEETDETDLMDFDMI